MRMTRIADIAHAYPALRRASWSIVGPRALLAGEGGE
jgi:hypothetical protein